MPIAAIAHPPPLREGDRLTSAEFLQRWEAIAEIEHAELIDGVVFMPSPIGLPHGRAHIELAAWLWHYAGRTPGCEALSETTWIMSANDVPQPDLAMRILPEYGGQSSETGSIQLAHRN
jgi:hypothetical protein